MAEELDTVDRIKGRLAEYQTDFAWVVANPPYGAKLTDSYKNSLREWWPDFFYGKPDTYVFFQIRFLWARIQLRCVVGY